MLNLEKIEAALGDNSASFEIRCLEQTDSTNLELRRAAMEGKGHGLVAAAEFQSAGRGRKGRSWESPAGENLYFSILLFPEFSQEKAPMLTLTAALAVADAIEEYGLDAKIKWPNDVVLNGKKVCGILTELGWRADGRYFVIIGIGINVNQRMFSEEITQTATSLFLQTEIEQERERILAAVLNSFLCYYNCFSKYGNLGSLRDRYEQLLINRGRAVKVLDPKGEWCGTALGINETGELLVRHEDGSLEAVYAGEVSVRGIYGYV